VDGGIRGVMSDAGHIDWDKEPDLEALRNGCRLLQSNPRDGLSLLKALAERGSLMSLLYLGEAYRKGEGLDTDLEKAETWFRRGADTGSAIASFHLAMFYREVNRYPDAISEFSKHSDIFPASAYRLGRMYQNGEGTNVDMGKTVELWEQASGLGHVYAKRNVAFLLMSGRRGFHKIPAGISLLFEAFGNLWSTSSKDPPSYLLR
jgi:TPR repeat protein